MICPRLTGNLSSPFLSNSGDLAANVTSAITHDMTDDKIERTAVVRRRIIANAIHRGCLIFYRFAIPRKSRSNANP